MTGTLLTVAEVASRLRCHPHTIRRWIWSGKLQAAKVGDLVRIPEEEVERMAQAKRHSRPASDHAVGTPQALLATMRRMRGRVKPEDVAEMERLIAEAETPADWSDPFA